MQLTITLEHVDENGTTQTLERKYNVHDNNPDFNEVVEELVETMDDIS